MADDPAPESPNLSDDEKIHLARLDADLRELELVQLVAELCGPTHRTGQRRDGRPPWCKTCGRTTRGIRIREGAADE